MDEENTASSLTRHLGRQPKGVEGAGQRHNAEVFVGAGDDPAFWHAEGVYIENNTIVNCQRGITVERVPKSQNARAGFRSDGKLEFYPSRVENNIVVFGHALGEGAAHGIRIGSSSGDADQQCLAWNPFADNPLGEGNPIIPVRNNWVWREGGCSGAYIGADWYASDYGDIDPRLFGERISDPGLMDNLRLSSLSNAKGMGNPYRIDIIRRIINNKKGYYAMRRSPGSFASSEETDYSVLVSPVQ